MHPYRQLWEKLAQTAKKLNLQLIKFIYSCNTSIYPSPAKRANKEYLIVCNFVFKNCGMVKLFEKTLPCN